MPDIGAALGSTVIFLFSQGGTVPIGTGFLVGYPVPGRPELSVPLVVTAKHVLGDNRVVQARFTTKEEKQPAMATYDIAALRAAGDYWEHKDPDIDIVVFRTPHFEVTKYEVVPLNLVATKKDWDDAGIQATDRVVFPTLLVNFMGTTKNYPVVRDGTISLIPSEPVPMQFSIGTRTVVTRQEVVLLDAIAIPGASGSPVFLWPGPRLQNGSFAIGGTKPFVLGVLHGFYSAVPREILEIESKPTEVNRLFAENSGVAIMFPSWRLREILESDEIHRRVDVVVGQTALPPVPSSAPESK